MKHILLSLIILISALNVAISQTYTNGSIYIDNSIECQAVTAHSGIITNRLIAETTYTTGNTVLLFSPTNLTKFYLSGNIYIIADANSQFSIDIFEQEINNLNATPRKATFGNYNLALTILSGRIAIESITNDSSAISLTAQDSAFQLNGGDFLFDVMTNTVVCYSTGNYKRILTHNSPNLNVKGAELLMEHNVKVTTTEPFQPTPKQLDGYNILIQKLNDKNVDFFVISGKLVGILTK